ncbi:MAG: response regulator [Nitrospiraceae bacterium]|nr:response regulator [Nitrospiraceae bacterium]
MARRLLLADDSITIQKVVELVLAEEDFEIKSVSNGEDALNLVESFNPDIVLADIEMPKMNGYQLCEGIKTNPRTAAIPVILLAGAFEPIDSALSKKVGADDSVIKPFESQELISKINAVLTMGAVSAVEAEVVAEPVEEGFDLGEEIEAAIQPETAEAVAEEDLWAMEDITETPDALAAEELTDADVFAAEAMPEVQAEDVFKEFPMPQPEPVIPAAAAVVAEPAAPREVRIQEVALPSREEITALIDRKVSEQASALFASLDLKDALLAALAPMLKDSIEKILWEMAPELVEKVTKETIKGAFSSISSEVEKVLWETVPELAGSMIAKEIEKIKETY